MDYVERESALATAEGDDTQQRGDGLPPQIRAVMDGSTGKERLPSPQGGAFTGVLLGKSVTLAYLGNLLYDLDSIQNYRLTTPSADIAASPTVLPCLGTVTVLEWGV